MTDVIAGLLNIEDSSRVFVNTIGQRVVYDAIDEVLSRWSGEVAEMLSFFVSEVMEDHKIRYYNIQGGRMQLQGGMAPALFGRTSGSWDVGFPLRQWGDAWGFTEIDIGYMTIQDIDKNVAGITSRNLNTLRRNILRALFYDNQIASYNDRVGNATYNIEPLANGDSVVYPPKLASEDQATENHYLIAGYAKTAISDSNNPIETMVAELAEHYGEAHDLDIVTFINDTEVSEVEALAGYTDVGDRFVMKGDDQNKLTSDGPPVPGLVIGRTDNSWISKWSWMPTGYMISVAMGEDAPLKMRVDKSGTGLARGLTLVAGTDSTFPLHGAQFRDRHGIAVANRLNGVVMELDTGAYAPPTGMDVAS